MCYSIDSLFQARCSQRVDKPNKASILLAPVKRKLERQRQKLVKFDFDEEFFKETYVFPFGYSACSDGAST